MKKCRKAPSYVLSSMTIYSNYGLLSCCQAVKAAGVEKTKDIFLKVL